MSDARGTAFTFFTIVIANGAAVGVNKPVTNVINRTAQFLEQIFFSQGHNLTTFLLFSVPLFSSKGQISFSLLEVLFLVR
jgi:hypothetical protein